MNKKDRRVGYYALKCIDKITNNPLESIDSLHDILQYIYKLPRKKKKWDITGTDKMHLFSSMSKTNGVYSMIFESIKYNHRPPLLDKDTILERDNPKKLSEGEAEKTHIVLKFTSREVLVTIEEHRPGIAIGTFTHYLGRFAQKYHESKDEKMDYSIEKFIIPKKDFLEELDKLIRVTSVDLYAEKQLLGSEYLNFSNRLEEVKNEIVISIKSHRNRSVKDNVREFFKKLIQEKSNLKKIRLTGKNIQGHNILLDTDIIKRIDFITVTTDPKNGQVKSADIFSQLKKAIEEIDNDS